MTLLHRLRLSAVLLALILATAPFLAAHADTAAADVVLKTSIDGVLNALNNKDFTADQRWDEVRSLSLKRFDLERMGKLTLGQANWSKLNADQQKEFVSLFTNLLLRSYSKRLDEYSGERIEFGKTEGDATKASVDTLLVSKDRKVPVQYKLYSADGDWRVYDVVIDGVSIIRTYRTQYDDYLKANSAEQFIAMIREKSAADK